MYQIGPTRGSCYSLLHSTLQQSQASRSSCLQCHPAKYIYRRRYFDSSCSKPTLVHTPRASSGPILVFLSNRGTFARILRLCSQPVLSRSPIMHAYELYTLRMRHYKDPTPQFRPRLPKVFGFSDFKRR
ncbi:hypothetical protein Hypma_007280 [Hypsizygus marmoreus]|uniref:Uncharacterized protein n=1 Tax=Hypsizygus marmoreus TaxID=39966 RepID=A0A369K6Q7_HYPMA|nr:hypothetical protein Hypma_007280 [Hypsizygus marmoreus]